MRELAEFGFATAKALNTARFYEAAEFVWNQAADRIDVADDAEQDKRRFFIRQDTWTAPVPNAGSN
jgi:putative alpha-1,2-mannosidase